MARDGWALILAAVGGAIAATVWHRWRNRVIDELRAIRALVARLVARDEGSDDH